MSGLSILIIDDDPEFPRLLGLMLGDEDFSITTTHDGEEGIRRCKEEAPDMVIVDASMPGIDGWEFTRRIRSSPNGVGSVPIIMLTGFADEKSQRQAYEVGVDLYLTKPIFRDALVLAINQVLGR